MGNGKTHGMEPRQRLARFQRAERRAVLAEQFARVGVRGHDPFGPPLRHGIHDTVQNLLPQIGHADFVGVGKGQRHAQGDGVGVFTAGAVLDSGVTARTGQDGQQ